MNVDWTKVAWRRSYACGADALGCVEVAMGLDAVAIRDSKDRDHSIIFSIADWRNFVEGVKLGQFDYRHEVVESMDH